MLLIASFVLITLALIFYSIGVWFERVSRYLKRWHVVSFWTGFFFDITGTLAMHRLAEGKFDILEPHTLTGQFALWLMLVHSVWATHVVKKDADKARRNFHHYSLVVWIIWLVPYFGGMYLGMSGK